jgi:hypothetical protein
MSPPAGSTKWYQRSVPWIARLSCAVNLSMQSVASSKPPVIDLIGQVRDDVNTKREGP